MAIAPNPEDIVKDVLRIYADAEQRMLEKLTRRLDNGIEEPNWHERKLAEIAKHRATMEAILKQIKEHGSEIITSYIIESYLMGVFSADEDLINLGAVMTHEVITPAVADEVYEYTSSYIKSEVKDISTETLGAFGLMHVESIVALAQATLNRLENAHVTILRNANDAYRQVIAEVIGSGLAGADTRRQVVQRALNKFADRGIWAFKDKAGRQWDIATYAEMSVRTGMAQARIQGHINRMTQQGHDLVRVSDHPEESPLCRPHERKIYSISGTHPKYKPLSWAIANGLFHPNCRHTINAYIDGLSDPDVPTPTADPEGYKLRMEQRKMERMIRKWKKRQAVAITEEEKQFAARKVREWQAKLREFVAEYDRRRDYSREQIHIPQTLRDQARKLTDDSKSRINKKIAEIQKLAQKQGGKISPKLASLLAEIGDIPPQIYLPWLDGVDEEIVRNVIEWTKEKGYAIGSDREWYERVKRDFDSDIKRWAEEHGMNEEDYRRARDEKMKQLVDKAMPTIRVYPNVLRMIVLSGRFKTQFETGTSGGLFSPERRLMVEKRAFGVPEDADVKDRPVYGYLDNERGDSTLGEWYGEIKVRLKKNNIIHRSTITYKDSLEVGSAGVPMWKPTGDIVPTDLLKPGLTDITDSDIHGGSYVEMQVHGGVTLDDIERIDAPLFAVDNVHVMEAIDRLIERGVEVRIYPDGIAGEGKWVTWEEALRIIDEM